jgi:uncharacterized protein (TIGR02271 family)
MGQIYEGMEVRSADGEKLGKIVAVGDSGTFVVEKGFFFPKDYTLALDDIVDIQNEMVILSRSREALGVEQGGWRSALGLEERRDETVTTGLETSRATGLETNMRATGLEATMRANEEIRMPLREEEVTATKHMEQVGEVRIRKEVVTEQRQITVPVTREVVTVERVPATEATVASTGKPFVEESISVPIREEKVDIAKHTVAREEVRVQKSYEQMEQPVSTTVRREVAEVERSGDVEQTALPRRKNGSSY